MEVKRAKELMTKWTDFKIENYQKTHQKSNHSSLFLKIRNDSLVLLDKFYKSSSLTKKEKKFTKLHLRIFMFELLLVFFIFTPSSLYDNFSQSQWESIIQPFQFMQYLEPKWLTEIITEQKLLSYAQDVSTIGLAFEFNIHLLVLVFYLFLLFFLYIFLFRLKESKFIEAINQHFQNEQKRFEKQKKELKEKTI